MTEDEMVEWHHCLNGHEFEQAPGVGDGQESLVNYNLWGHKESDVTELNCLSLSSFPGCSLPFMHWGSAFEGRVVSCVPHTVVLENMTILERLGSVLMELKIW